MELKFTVQTKIQKPVAEVYDAVRDPKKLEKYFATAGASGPPEEGKTITWKWADFPNIGKVQVKKVVPNRLIVFEWGVAEGGYNTRTEIKFEPLGDKETLVNITESGWNDTAEGIKSSYGNCFGWTQMMASLKAFLEYNINLRKGWF